MGRWKTVAIQPMIRAGVVSIERPKIWIHVPSRRIVWRAPLQTGCTCTHGLRSSFGDWLPPCCLWWWISFIPFFGFGPASNNGWKCGLPCPLMLLLYQNHQHHRRLRKRMWLWICQKRARMVLCFHLCGLHIPPLVIAFKRLSLVDTYRHRATNDPNTNKAELIFVCVLFVPK